MKFKSTCLIVLMIGIMLVGVSSATNDCFGAGCHGTGHRGNDHADCGACHRGATLCTNTTFLQNRWDTGTTGTSSGSSSGMNIYGEIVDMPAIRASAVDTWKKFNEGGFGTFVLGGVFLAAVLSIVLGFAGGIGFGAIGGLTKKPGISTLGESMVSTAWKYAILFPIGLAGLFLMFAFI